MSFKKRKQQAEEEAHGPCSAEKTATFDPSHIHSCIGNHAKDVAHYCTGCHRWWA